MRPQEADERETTLDPASPAEWSALRSLGHAMIDDMFEHLQTVRERPAWRPVPPSAQEAIGGPIPRAPSSADDVYAAFKEHILPYPNGNTHPRFWGWAQGTGTPLAMLADMLASGMNPHLAGFEQSAVLVEQTVVAWLSELLGFPREATGVLTAGGTMANIIGLAVARHAAANDVGFDLRANGLQHPECPRFVVFASCETHGWANKAVELLGLGRAALRTVSVDAEYRLDAVDLAAKIAEARREGLHPACVIATAGSINTGAVDDLDALATLCAREGLWLHVDGAFGALAALSERHAGVVRGLERADSVAFDLHKWMYLPFEVACVLVRRPGVQRATFAASASYLAATGRGVSAGAMVFSDLGVDLTRSFRALKVWMALKTHGADRLGALVGQNIDQAAYLAARIDAAPELQRMAPRALNVVCFRFVAAGLDETTLDALNTEILLRIQEAGVAIPSSTRIHGRFVLRVAVLNHRSIRADFDLLVSEVVRHGRAIVRERADDQ